MPLSVYDKLYFFNPRFDSKTNTFSGVIYWPYSYKGVDYTEYTLVFHEDMKSIKGGLMVFKKENGVVCGEEKLTQ